MPGMTMLFRAFSHQNLYKYEYCNQSIIIKMGIRFNELNKRLINTVHKSNAHVVESAIKPTADREHFFQ
jgi:hypothetical protein